MSIESPTITQEEIKARHLIIEKVGNSKQPISLHEIREESDKEKLGLTQADLRTALWYLVDRGDIQFTPDRLLIKTDKKAS